MQLCLSKATKDAALTDFQTYFPLWRRYIYLHTSPPLLTSDKAGPCNFSQLVLRVAVIRTRCQRYIWTLPRQEGASSQTDNNILVGLLLQREKVTFTEPEQPGL